MQTVTYFTFAGKDYKVSRDLPTTPYDKIVELFLPFYESFDIVPYLTSEGQKDVDIIKEAYRPFVAGGYVFDNIKGGLEPNDIDLYFPLLKLFDNVDCNPFVDYLKSTGFNLLTPNEAKGQEYSYLYLLQHEELGGLNVQVIPYVSIEDTTKYTHLFKPEKVRDMDCDDITNSFDLDVCKVAFDLKNKVYVEGTPWSNFFAQLDGVKPLHYAIRLNQLKKDLAEDYVKECTYKRLYKYARKGCTLPGHLELTEDNMVHYLKQSTSLFGG